MNKCLCGHTPEPVKNGGVYRVICSECGRHGASCLKEELAVMTWNDYIEFISKRKTTNAI